MSFTGGQTIADEVYFRINGRLTTAQIIPYVNRALNLISAAASWRWDKYTASGATATLGVYTPSPSYPIDPGKAITVYNATSSTPVAFMQQGDQGLLAAGYVDQSSTKEFNVFAISYTAGVGAYLRLYPSSVTSTIDVTYHLLPPVLTYASSPTVYWDVQWMDDILIDYTEALISRILRWTGYAELEENARQRLIAAAKNYSTERINVGPLEEATTAVQEKESVGRE